MARFQLSRHGEISDISPWRDFRYLAMARYLISQLKRQWLAPLRGASHGSYFVASNLRFDLINGGLWLAPLRGASHQAFR